MDVIFASEDLSLEEHTVPSRSLDDFVIETIDASFHKYIARIQLHFQHERERVEALEPAMSKECMVQYKMNDEETADYVARSMDTLMKNARDKCEWCMFKLSCLRMDRLRKFREWKDAIPIGRGTCDK